MVEITIIGKRSVVERKVFWVD